MQQLQSIFSGISLVGVAKWIAVGAVAYVIWYYAKILRTWLATQAAVDPVKPSSTAVAPPPKKTERALTAEDQDLISQCEETIYNAVLTPALKAKVAALPEQVRREHFSREAVAAAFKKKTGASKDTDYADYLAAIVKKRETFTLNMN